MTFPVQDTLQHVIKAFVESGVTNGGKNIASFLFREWTQQHKHEATSYKATIFKVIPEEKR